MTSSYRSNAKEEVLRARYDSAKRTIDEIAERAFVSFLQDEPDQDAIFDEIREDYPDAADLDMSSLFIKKRQEIRQRPQHLEEALTSIGYEKTIIQKEDAQRIVYVRYDGDMMDVLCDMDILNGRDPICLYRAPKTSIEDFLENTKKLENNKDYSGHLCIGAFLGGLPISAILVSLSSGNTPLLIAGLATFAGSLFSAFYSTRPNTLLLSRMPARTGKQALLDACKPTKEHQQIMDEIKFQTGEQDYEKAPVQVRVDVPHEYAERKDFEFEDVPVRAVHKRAKK